MLKLSPALHRAYLRVLTRQKVGSHHARYAARGPGPGFAAFDGLRALRSSELQGRDEEQGFSGPNKEQGQAGSRQATALPANFSVNGEVGKEHSRGALGLLYGENGNDTGSIEKIMFDRWLLPALGFCGYNIMWRLSTTRRKASKTPESAACRSIWRVRSYGIRPLSR